MKYHYLIFTVAIILNCCSCTSQRQVPGKIYNTEGRLIANDSFHISPKQMRKFGIIENQLIDTLLSRFRYPAVYRENRIRVDLIIEFTLNGNGQATDIKITKAHAAYDRFDEEKFKKELLPYFSKQLKEAITNMQCSNEFNGKNEHYYIPVKFTLGAKSERKVENGWLLLVDHEIIDKYNIRY